MADRPEKKKRSGCAVALFVVMGVVAIGVIAGGYAIYRFSQSEEGQQLVGAVTEATKWAIAASAAPGASALRDEGCEEALVTSWGDLMQMMGAFEAAGAEQDTGELPPETTVLVCSGPAFGWTAPSCDDIARVYGTAIPEPPAEFLVQVMEDGRDEPLCIGMYDPAGEESPDWTFE